MEEKSLPALPGIRQGQRQTLPTPRAHPRLFPSFQPRPDPVPDRQTRVRHGSGVRPAPAGGFTAKSHPWKPSTLLPGDLP